MLLSSVVVIYVIADISMKTSENNKKSALGFFFLYTNVIQANVQTVEFKNKLTLAIIISYMSVSLCRFFSLYSKNLRASKMHKFSEVGMLRW